MVEMVVGVFYVALVVARLVGLGASRRWRERLVGQASQPSGRCFLGSLATTSR